MRIASLQGRMVIVADDHAAADIELASQGLFGPEPDSVYGSWEDFRKWAANSGRAIAARMTALTKELLGPPSPAPAQVFAIGLNYPAHAAESGTEAGSRFPQIFTKFRDALAGPYGAVKLPSSHVDWEVELVVAIGVTCRNAAASAAWNYVAGVMVGQDFSERELQAYGSAPQWSVAKSFEGFGPTGPWLVTPDELSNPSDLAIACTINGETVQAARTSDMALGVPELVAAISSVCTLRPGDLIFTGTPAGVGMSRAPQRFLQPGDIVTSSLEGVGTIEQRCVQGARTTAAPWLQALGSPDGDRDSGG
ncbi:MAG TPA: fumarylacetoacetate hydrolase family protein [Streptosporangiaceae bacterium]|nr:fumarylacetoacetate hydrolase family protein [Streptosporangiaceae bacterium]